MSAHEKVHAFTTDPVLQQRLAKYLVLQCFRNSDSVRMTNRRYTRLTNAFSKKVENHAAAVALGYFAYNFIQIHRTLRMTPAMAAGVTDRLWDIADLVEAWEAEERSAQRAA